MAAGMSGSLGTILSLRAEDFDFTSLGFLLVDRPGVGGAFSV